MNPDLFHAVVMIFPLHLFTTRALNKGAPDTRTWRILRMFERVCLVGVAAGFVTLQYWLVQFAMTACVAVYLLRVLVRCFGLGF